MTTVRIYNDPKDKRNFIRQMVQDFQEYEDISDFKASVFELGKETSIWEVCKNEPPERNDIEST